MSSRQPASLENLVNALKRLPGVGARSAQRYAYHLLQRDREGAEMISEAMAGAIERIRHCLQCNTFTEAEICETCSSPRRNRSMLCVVENPPDQLMVEQTMAFDGLYFVLMGRLSPIDGIGPGDIAMNRLIERADDGVVTEVVLATNFTQEGEATAHYIAELLKARGISVTRLASGVPVGSELEYVDASTIAQAMRDRRSTD